MTSKHFRKNIHLTFPPDVSGNPVVCNLTRLYDLSFNILKAQITPRKEGYMTLELIGSEENYRKGVEYLADNGIRVAPVAQRISRDEESCMHCGMCTAICPNSSLCMDREMRVVLFDKERCTACGMCVRICPVNAMSVETENGPW
ncbi:NIL domain-containing protein [Desulfovibrio psychrotolerans]|uniref:(Fe-S)-binding protein n=1 Tax=Desulfovibrio psychrotolerans TaxID=415242 RepID=A0A7J0BXC5_9BACT|nr:NIL domain-containing protein [Desulfovibrio psychrotolerans]GFM38356.1 (Fe-S)-binding protein [Desulfovibrio psychrotolerans]